MTVEKRKGLESSVASAEGVMSKITEMPATKEAAALATAFALWGNKMDLSIWPTSSAEGLKEAFTKIIESSSENLLHDDTDKLTDYCEKLRSSGGGNIDIIVDNAGFELVVDLALADHLIATGIAKSVTFQLKAHPTFVSDALEKDLRETGRSNIITSFMLLTISYLLAYLFYKVLYYASLDSTRNPNCVSAGKRWQKYLDDEKWLCNEDFFWVQPLGTFPSVGNVFYSNEYYCKCCTQSISIDTAMWDMHEPLFQNMNSRCDLAFVKGDANYRRLLGKCTPDKFHHSIRNSNSTDRR